MRPRANLRKRTSISRIGLNNFWNELEDFYNAMDKDLPDYTTDIFDHDREAAENSLNERLEDEYHLQQQQQKQQRQRQQQSLDEIQERLKSVSIWRQIEDKAARVWKPENGSKSATAMEPAV